MTTALEILPPLEIFRKELRPSTNFASEPKNLRLHHILLSRACTAAAIKNLKAQELDKAIINAARRGVPILGICLGMQILYEYSEEGMLEGLGLMKGRVVKKIPSNTERFKVPNVGWLSVECKKTSSLFKNINNHDSIFYFANSYAVKSANQSHVTSTYNFDDDYVASSENVNVYGINSSRKSGDVGRKLIKNFLNLGQKT